MFLKLQILILSVVLYLSAALVAADVDCSKRPERVNPKICCPLPELISDEIKEKCKAYDKPPPPPPGMSDEATSNEANNVTQSGTKHPPHHHHHHNPCFASCVLNETGIYVNKSLDANKLNSYLQIVFKDSADLQAVIEESFTTCAAKIEQFKGHPPPPPPSPPSGEENLMPPPFCPHSAGKLMGCVFKTTFKNCPKSLWNDNQQCNDLREHFENCKHSHGPHGPHGPSMSPDEVASV